MSKVSIIIPTAGEPFLKKTIDSILENAVGDIEIFVFFDGCEVDKSIGNDPRIKVIKSPNRVGIHAAINTAAEQSTGEYIMKLDGHCMLDEGFDEKLKADCQDNWLCIPRRCALEAKDGKWERGRKITDYAYITPPNKKPKDAPRFWELGFCALRYYPPKDQRPSDSNLHETMTFQGSCWFIKKDYFNAIDGLRIPESHWYESINLACKVWLSGGRVIRNKNTWYAHLHKGKTFGRGFYMSRHERAVDRERIIDFWLHNKWDKQIHDFKWLIDKFSPLDGWENWDWNTKWKQ